jgi:hypothetical protein
MMKVKKILVAAMFAMISAASANAQLPVDLSVRAGLNVNSISQGRRADNSYMLGDAVGFNVGAYADYAIRGGFGVQAGLVLTQKGSAYADENVSSGSGTETKASVGIFELQVPVLATYTLGFADFSNVKLKLHAGPALGFGLSANYKTADRTMSSNTWSSWSETSTNLYDSKRAKSFELGFVFGAGLLYQKYYLGVSYDYGLTDIAGHPSGATDYYRTHNALRTGSFSINVGIRSKIKFSLKNLAML